VTPPNGPIDGPLAPETHGAAGRQHCSAFARAACTPTFADKATSGVQHTVNVLRQRAIPMRIVKAGDRLTAGDVNLEVFAPVLVEFFKS